MVSFMVGKWMAVVTVDVKGSRRLADRKSLQEMLKELLDEINLVYKKDLQAPFMITLGDEFQGAVRKGSTAYKIYRTINKELPVSFYCGIGIDAVTTDIDPRVVAMDGPVFHLSREALIEAKLKRRELVIKTKNSGFNRITNTIALLCQALRDRQTKRQKEIADMVEDMSRKEVAEHYKVSKQAISKILKKSKITEILEAEDLLEEMLERYLVNPKEFTWASQLNKVD